MVIRDSSSFLRVPRCTRRRCLRAHLERFSDERDDHLWECVDFPEHLGGRFYGDGHSELAGGSVYLGNRRRVW